MEDDRGIQYWAEVGSKEELEHFEETIEQMIKRKALSDEVLCGWVDPFKKEEK